MRQRFSVLVPSVRHARATAIAALLAVTGAGSVSAADESPAADSNAPVTLQTTVVTAEKQGRSLHDTATSTDVLDAQALEERGDYGSRDVLANAANVTAMGQGNAAPSIRGIDGTGAAQGVDAFFAGTRPRLNVTVDGRPLSYNEIVFGDSGLWDVEQVELLRGAQSLLQGRNAIAGTLAIKTRDPSFAPEAGVMALGGDYDRVEGAFYASGPLVADQLAVRVSGDIQRHQSFLDFGSFPGTDDPGQFDTRNLRAKLLYKSEALPGFSELVTFQHASSRAPQAESVSRPFDDTDVPSTAQMPVFASRSNSLISDTGWDFADRLRFQNLFTATDLHVDRFAPAGTGVAAIDTDQYVLEPRLVLDRGDSATSGILGVYLFKANQHEFIDYPFPETFTDRVKTAALYAEGAIAFAGNLELTLGARYEREEHRRYGGDGMAVRVDIDKDYDALLPKLGLAWHPSAAWTLGVVASRGYNAGGGGVTFGVPVTTYSYDPEYVRDYEAYFRGDLAGGRVQITGNVFHGDYDDLQLLYVLDPDPLNYSAVIRNARRAHNTGAELGLRWFAVEGFEVHADVGLLRTRITDYPGSGVEGNQFAGAPSFTSDFGVAWHAAGGFEASFDVRRSNAYYSDVENRPFGRVDAYWLARAKAGFHFGRAFVFAGVNNLFDQRGPVGIYTATSVPTPYDWAQLQQPRAWYAGLRYDFR